MNVEIYQTYIALLKKELIPAMGCTEPIAIAYAASLAQKVLKDDIVKVEIAASGNMIKNVKSVTVPNTNGRKGIQAAAAIGIIAGNSDFGLEVIRDVNEEQLYAFEKFLQRTPIEVKHLNSACPLEVSIYLTGKKHTSFARIQESHSNVVCIERDGKKLFEKANLQNEKEDAYQSLSMKGIYEFALHVNIEDVKEILDRQIHYNSAIALEGLKHPYGANIAGILLSTYGNSVQVRAKAYPAAGSDARMGGCELPVIINSGSGNQGMSASLPVIEYAKELGVEKEKLYRALLISNLSTMYQKAHIGKLSAYCGAVSAGAGAGAGIAYLLGGDFDHICHTIVNALAITSGIICDGAKASCAAKIATAVDAGILGCHMYQQGKQFYNGEGIVCCNIEETIDSVGILAREGMKETDDEIIKIMMKQK